MRSLRNARPTGRYLKDNAHPLSQPTPPPDYSAPMRLALAAAEQAGRAGDVPVGAVLLDASGDVVATDRNRREELRDPTAHAEILVLSARAREIGDWRLLGHTLVVTLEPCPMCAGAAVWARLDRLVYGAADPKAGAAWSLYNIPQDRRLNHRIQLIEGVLADDSRRLLEDFFGEKRL
jgi:tRNA(adenine34) deaminase